MPESDKNELKLKKPKAEKTEIKIVNSELPVPRIRNFRNNVVQKSNPLIGLYNSEFSLSALKLVDIYLSRINSHDPDSRMVEFDQKELQDLLGVKRIHITQIDKVLNEVAQYVTVDNIEKEGTARIALFEYIAAQRDPGVGWRLQMCCTQSAMNYIFNIESIGYLRYTLKYTTQFRSRYSYHLYMYTKKNFGIGTWKISVENLAVRLAAKPDMEYKQLKRNLDRAVKEINECTDITIQYSELKRHRRVDVIQFTVKPKENYLKPVLSKQEKLEAEQKQNDEQNASQNLSEEELKERLTEYTDTKYGDFFPDMQSISTYIDSVLEKMSKQRKRISSRLHYAQAMIDNQAKEDAFMSLKLNPDAQLHAQQKKAVEENANWFDQMIEEALEKEKAEQEKADAFENEIEFEENHQDPE